MQQILNGLDLENSSIKLYFITKEVDSYNAYSVDLNNLAEKFKRKFLSNLQQEINEKPLEAFDVISPEDDCIEYLASNEVNNLKEIKSLLNPITAPPITDLNLVSNELWGYVAVFTLPNKQQVNLFRKYVSVSAYKAKAQFRMKNGRLEEIKPEQSVF